MHKKAKALRFIILFISFLFTFPSNSQAVTYGVFLNRDKIGVIDSSSGKFTAKTSDPEGSSTIYFELYQEQIDKALELIHSIFSCFQNEWYSYYGSLKEDSENTPLTFFPSCQNCNYLIKERLVTRITEDFCIDMIILNPETEDSPGIFFYLALGFNNAFMETKIPFTITAVASEEKQQVALPSKAITVIHEKPAINCGHDQLIEEDIEMRIINEMRKPLSQYHEVNTAPQNSPDIKQSDARFQFGFLQYQLDQIDFTSLESCREDTAQFDSTNGYPAVYSNDSDELAASSSVFDPMMPESPSQETQPLSLPPDCLPNSQPTEDITFTDQTRIRHFSAPGGQKRKKLYSNSPNQSPDLSRKRHSSTSDHDKKW